MKRVDEVPKLLTVKEASKLLGIPVGAVRKRLFLGQLPRLKLGHNVYIPSNKLLQMINEKTSEPNY